jgi:predicted RNA binding protein YcfA (HicA-like mRNA interferase family)
MTGPGVDLAAHPDAIPVSPFTQTKPSDGLSRLAAHGAVPVDKARCLLATLERKPLGYRVARQTGSHRRLEASDRPPLTFAFHDNVTIPSGLVHKILVRDIGLAEDEARKLL